MDSNKSILIIDDDDWSQRILTRSLKSFGYKTIYTASDGFEGLNLAFSQKPALILLDLMIPEVSGHMILKMLKSIQATRNIPVLIVSALSDEANINLAKKYGAAGYITKPFTNSGLHVKLAEILNKDNIDQMPPRTISEE